MITLVSKATIKAGKLEEYKAVVGELAELSRKEEGCISYGLFEDLKDPNILTFIEEWEDDEALKFHNQTEHFIKFGPKIKELREEGSVTNLYKKIV
ncbi:MAG: antibiotic biosynthesis monooxygenase [Eubacteriaceae bacterium]|nr:antibiotic biosynthesis monooxygenase [Eubacteriaceae bacterium]